MIRRRLFPIASAISLLLCVATVALWVRSYHRIDYIVLVQHKEGFYLLMSHEGAIRAQPVNDIYPERMSYSISYKPHGWAAPPIVECPHAFLTLILAAAPGLWLYSTFQRHRREPQIAFRRCVLCAYNLTGNTSGICPECGTPATP